MRTTAIILAAGRGSRMKSELPKILHTVNDVPLIVFPLKTLTSIKISQMVTVVKHRADLILPYVIPYSEIAYQGEEYGTAKAVQAALPFVDNDSNTVMVVNGDDSMFYKDETFMKVLSKHKEEGNAITFITLLKSDPSGYGRVVYDKYGKFKKIVEDKDATHAQKKIKEVNDGVYVFDKRFLAENIKNIKASKATGEYYLTDLINFALNNRKRIGTYLLENTQEFFGVSTQEDIRAANEQYADFNSLK